MVNSHQIEIGVESTEVFTKNIRQLRSLVQNIGITIAEAGKLFLALRSRMPAGRRRQLRRQARYQAQPCEHIK